MKCARRAESAQARRRDAVGNHAGLFELGSIDAFQIQFHRAGSSAELWAPSDEMCRYFGAYLIAAFSNRGSDSSPNVRRRCSISGFQFPNGTLHDRFGRASPSRVNRRDGALVRVGQKNRDTIRRTDPDPELWTIGNQRIGFADIACRTLGFDYDGRVDLLCHREALGIRPGIGVSGRKPVLEPGERLEVRRSEDVIRIFPEEVRHQFSLAVQDYRTVVTSPSSICVKGD